MSVSLLADDGSKVGLCGICLRMFRGEINNHLCDEIQVEDDEGCVEEDFHFVEGELGGVCGYW